MGFWTRNPPESPFRKVGNEKKSCLIKVDKKGKKGQEIPLNPPLGKGENNKKSLPFLKGDLRWIIYNMEKNENKNNKII